MVWISNITKQYEIFIQFKEEMLIPKDLLNNSQAYFELKMLKFESEGDNRIRSYKGSKRQLVDEDQKLSQDTMEFTWEVKD